MSEEGNIYPLVRELRKLDEAVRAESPNAALVLRASANQLERYDHTLEALKGLIQDIKQGGSSSRENQEYITRLERILR